jgi:hypothetical protein
MSFVVISFLNEQQKYLNTQDQMLLKLPWRGIFIVASCFFFFCYFQVGSGVFMSFKNLKQKFAST